MGRIKVLTKHQGEKDTHTLAHYKSVGGYNYAIKSSWHEARRHHHRSKNSGLIGRGGAGFQLK